LAIQQLNSLGIVETERQLNSLQDRLYEQAKSTKDGFKGLMEIISSKPTIISAIHKIKSNKGAMTAGIDELTIRTYLEQNYDKTITDIQNSLSQYKANKVRRVWIPKPGKRELRPLGIPTIIDRVIQECIRMVIEPICEGRFFQHSYGFRPMRSAHHALERLTNIVHSTGYNWVVEGDIRKFFDEVNHRILLKSLWGIGIHDKRLLMVIKQMLKAGILNETHINEIGTPQGGILSPILANVYLNRFDHWINQQWHGFETEYNYKALDGKLAKLRKTNLKPAYLVRYADDWCLVTNTKENAQKWKYSISMYLIKELKLELSKEKTLITNLKRQKVKFVGFEYKVIKRKNTRKGHVTKTEPDRKRLIAKRKELREKARSIRRAKDKNDLLRLISLYNSSIRGIVNYYAPATYVNVSLGKIDDNLTYTVYKSLKRFGAKWYPANQTSNLPSVHSNYKTQVPTISLGDIKVGITRLSFVKWTKTNQKNQSETPYSPKGRAIYKRNTGKKSVMARADELLSDSLINLIGKGITNNKYNFEYAMNRAYVFNIDMGNCRICKLKVDKGTVHIHHVRPYLPINETNRTNNLATVCIECHKKIHNQKDYSGVLEKSINKKLNEYRDKLIKNG
jgi:RNA-directed DNA polymerase